MVPGSTHRYLSLAGFALVAALGSCGLLNCDTALRASILSLPFSPSAHAGADGWSLSASIASSPALGYGYLAMVVLTVVAYARVWGSNPGAVVAGPPHSRTTQLPCFEQVPPSSSSSLSVHGEEAQQLLQGQGAAVGGGEGVGPADGEPRPVGFCFECRFIKPLRSKHCYKCGMCVVKFDHHCPFLGVCIGANNHPAFMCFTGLSCLINPVGAYLFSAPNVRTELAGGFSSVSRNALCVLFSLLSLLACVMLGVHTYLAATGQTTYQLIMRERDMMSRRARHPGRGPQHRDSQPGSDPSALADSQQSQLRGVRVVAATHAPDMGIGGLGVVGGAGGAGGGPRQGDDGGEWSGGGGCASCCSGVCGAGPQWSESKWDEGVCNNLAAFARGATRREWRVGLLEEDYRAIKQQSEQGRAGQRGRF